MFPERHTTRKEEQNWQILTHTLLFCFQHTLSHVIVPPISVVHFGWWQFSGAHWLWNMAQNNVVGKVAMGHIRVLVAVFKELVSIDWLTPEGVAYQFSQMPRYFAMNQPFAHTSNDSNIDAVDDVVTEVESIEEVCKFRIMSGTQRLIDDSRRKRKPLRLDDTIYVSVRCQSRSTMHQRTLDHSSLLMALATQTYLAGFVQPRRKCL